MQYIWQATRILGQNQFHGKKGVPWGGVLRDQIPGYFCPVGTYGMYVYGTQVIIIGQ